MMLFYPSPNRARIALVFLVFALTSAFSQTDNCTGTLSSLSFGKGCTISSYTISEGFNNDGPALCTGTSYRDGWFRFTTDATTYNISIEGTSNRQMGLAIYTACGSAEVASIIPGTANATLRATVLPGTVYLLRIMRTNNAANDAMSGTVCVRKVVSVNNDNPNGATSLPVNLTCSPTSSTNLGATAGTGIPVPGCANYNNTNSNDVWFSFAVPAGGRFTVDTAAGSLTDAGMALYSGSCSNNLTLIECIDDDGFDLMPRITRIGHTPGSIIYVRVWSFTPGDTGTFTICVTTPCYPGSGTGTTSLECPNVVSGGLDLDGDDPAAVECFASGCVELEATYTDLHQTTSYMVSSIPYNPPYQFNCLANRVSIDNDDVWSPLVNLPFNFCFYGNTYSSCLIGSNGVLTFDLVNHAPGGYNDYILESNLPDPNLFMNTIFGVFHDIDPRYGGEVGWELVTLANGCRALVAAWSDIPMYSDVCHSILYTGMIVLHENSNIIEVYIKDKGVCSTFNDGNAVVGIQNGNGTQAVVAPNRNGLSPNWNVTNEAWRFTPSGASISSLVWFEGAGTSGPIVGTTSTINVCPATTTTYTARVTYSFCDGTTRTETDQTTVTVIPAKDWNGSTSSNWNTAANWTPAGVPTATNCVRVPSAPNNCVISGSGFNAQAYNVRVENDGTLNVQTTNFLTINAAIDIIAGGNFTMENSSSLLQTTNVANSGTANIRRISQPMYRYDYTYWNSPVTLASGFTLGNLSPQTLSDKYFSWQPFVGSGTGNWQMESSATVMDPRKGYIVRAPQTFSMNPATKLPYTATFTGTPNNGPVLAPISHGILASAITDDKWNLIGNPYPSGLSAASFLMHPDNIATVDGTIYLWTHNSPPSELFGDPFYGDFVYNYSDGDYASWNLLGGVGTVASSGGPQPNGIVASGQSFFIRSLVTGGTARFDNSMRVGAGNSQFFRMAASSAVAMPEKNRIWLNMTGNVVEFCQMMVGYTTMGTLGFDRAIDGRKNEGNGFSFYSHIPEEKLSIQDRPMPFETTDIVPLGYRALHPGEYHIGIDSFDDFFLDQNVYLEDFLLGTYHDLKTAPYVFYSDAGRFDGRFVLRYEIPSELAVSESEKNHVVSFISDDQLYLSSDRNVKKLALFDMTGKHLGDLRPSGTALSQIWNFPYAEGAYMARIEFLDGSVSGQKLLNH